MRAARPLPPDDFEKLRRLLWAARWRTASSMPSIPHSYTLRAWWNDDEAFRWCIAALRASGYHAKFGGRTYLYTDVDEYQVFDAAAAGPEEAWIDVMELDPRPGREGQYKVAGINRAVRRPTAGLLPLETPMATTVEVDIQAILDKLSRGEVTLAAARAAFQVWLRGEAL
ncbi:MAG: hypothetical protein WD690_13935 [Vicinamibacterales bacterium]